MKHCNIPIFVPHRGCPFDCVFCNQKHITGVLKDLDDEQIRSIIDEHLRTIPEDTEKEIAFFGGSFTGIEESVRKRYLQLAYEYVKKGAVSGIRISTRPDYIDEHILEQLKSFGVRDIELGVQSMDKEVLAASNRGHTPEDVKKASKLIKRYGFRLGLQMMTGLPKDTPEKSLKTADEIIALKPGCVRIYPTLVIEDTRLCEMYRAGEYAPQSLEDAVDLTAKLLEKFDKKNIPVIRVALAVTEEISPGGMYVAGPFHSAFRELCQSRIFYERIRAAAKRDSTVTAAVNPSDISKLIGNKKSNITRLKNEMNIDLIIKRDKRIKRGNIIIRDILVKENQRCI